MLMFSSLVFIMSAVIFFAGFLNFISSWGHILSSLVALEFMALAIYFSMAMASGSIPLNMFSTLVYISVAVCEGALGLSILVVATKASGNDLLASMSLISW